MADQLGQGSRLEFALNWQRPRAPNRGENAGSTLVEYNIVRELRRLGDWTGNAIDLQLDVDAADKNMGCAVILQVDGNGPILGVAAAPESGQGL